MNKSIVFSRRPFRSSGFTLLEMILVDAMLAILASVAIPSYQQIMSKKAVERATLQLRDHMELARVYGQTHQTQVVVCPVAENQLNQDAHEPACMGLVTNWPAWVVKTQDGQVLVSSLYLPQGVTIDSGGRDKFVFNERGGANGDNGTVNIRGLNHSAQTITIASDGRIQLDATAARSGVTTTNSSSSAAASHPLN